ncbi:unnamed protein product [Malus baccata var. baccata]
MPCAVLARVGKDFVPLELLFYLIRARTFSHWRMPCAVLALAVEDLEPLEHLMHYAVLARAGEDFEPLE